MEILLRKTAKIEDLLPVGADLKSKPRRVQSLLNFDVNFQIDFVYENVAQDLLGGRRMALGLNPAQDHETVDGLHVNQTALGPWPGSQTNNQNLLGFNPLVIAKGYFMHFIAALSIWLDSPKNINRELLLTILYSLLIHLRMIENLVIVAPQEPPAVPRPNLGRGVRVHRGKLPNNPHLKRLPLN